MLNVKIGDVVHGYVLGHKTNSLILVDEIKYYPHSDEIMSVCGRLIGEAGRVTQRYGCISHHNPVMEKKLNLDIPDQDFLSGIKSMPTLRKGGWVIIEGYELEGSKLTLAERIRALQVDETLEILKADHSLSSCRVAASLIGADIGRRYSVSKTEAGCVITRSA